MQINICPQTKSVIMSVMSYCHGNSLSQICLICACRQEGLLCIRVWVGVGMSEGVSEGVVGAGVSEGVGGCRCE